MNQADHAVKLQFGVTLQQIIDMDERNQLLKSNLWLEYMWTDVNLAWNEVSRDLKLGPFKFLEPSECTTIKPLEMCSCLLYALLFYQKGL